MTSADHRWDPSLPGFTTAVLRTLCGCYGVIVVAGMLASPPALSGLIAGGGLAVALYLIALQAGRVFVRTKNFAKVMAWLIVSQCIIWVGTAVLVAAIKVHPIGFVLGVSILPLAIVVTLAYYAIRKELSKS